MMFTGVKTMCKRLSLIAVGVLLTFGVLFATAYFGIRYLTCSIFRDDEPRTYESWKDLKDDELLIQMVPRSATNIKRCDFGGFRAYQCNVSCKVSLKGLEEFAKERGYNFEQVDSEGAVDFGLATQKGRSENNSFCERAFSKGKFLRCEFSRKSADGLVQHFLLCYDIVQEKLCCQYSDD